jgi:hypothetical protein
MDYSSIEASPNSEPRKTLHELASVIGAGKTLQHFL